MKRRIRCTCWRTLYINSYTDGAYTNITNPLPTRRPSLTCHGESRGDRSPQEEAARRQHDHILLRLQPERKDAKRDIYRLIPFRGDVEVTRKTLSASVENKTTLMGKTLESVRDVWLYRSCVVGQRLRVEFMLGLKRSLCGTPTRTSSHSPLFSSPSLHTALTCNIRFHFCNLGN